MENGKSRLQQAQEDVDEVTVIMLDNLNKAEERSGKLEDLGDRAEELEEKSKNFQKISNKVRVVKEKGNRRLKFVFIGIGVVAVLVIIGLIIFASLGAGGE